jgi:hypothetical protein
MFPHRDTRLFWLKIFQNMALEKRTFTTAIKLELKPEYKD